MKTKLSFMEKKFFTMLGGGTIGSVLASLLIIIDAIIAGIFIGENVVAGVNLITPVYSLAAFLGMIVSEGISEYETVALNEYIGRHDSGEIRRTMRICVIDSNVEGVVFSCLFAFMAWGYFLLFFVTLWEAIRYRTWFGGLL